VTYPLRDGRDLRHLNAAATVFARLRMSNRIELMHFARTSGWI
jgi:hypothetical protein